MTKVIDACLIKNGMLKVERNRFYQIKEEGDENLAAYLGLKRIKGQDYCLFATREKHLAILNGKAWLVDGVVVASDDKYHEEINPLLARRARNDHQREAMIVFGRSGL